MPSPKDTHHSAATDQVRVTARAGDVTAAELASAARERLFALAVRTGLQAPQAMLAEDLAWLVGSKGDHIPELVD